MTAVLEGASVSCKTMSDGTLRLSIDIEPRNAQAAFALFGAPGRAVALAALKDGAGAITSESASEVKEKQQAPKGGEWAKLAGMWCNDPDFWMWANRENWPVAIGLITNPEEAAELVRKMCAIDSRAELDHNMEAQRRFVARIRNPFQKWMIARGIRKAAP